MSQIESITEISQLFVPELGGLPAPEAAPRDLSDRANLITKVYTDAGIFSPAYAEQAPELLRPKLSRLATAPAGLAVESFVVVNLISEHDLELLMAGYNKGKRHPTTPWPKLWNQYLVADINRRTVPGQGGIEPVAGDVRAHVLTPPENEHNEFGLAGTTKNIAAQREFIGSRVVLNLPDYVLIQKLRQEEGKPPLDKPTLTRFVQMDTKEVGGASYVGDAYWSVDRLNVHGSDGFPYGRNGVRFSDGADQAVLNS